MSDGLNDRRFYVGPNDSGGVPDFISDELQEIADEDGYVTYGDFKQNGEGVLVPK
jgi:hypothetical protein